MAGLRSLRTLNGRGACYPEKKVRSVNVLVWVVGRSRILPSWVSYFFLRCGSRISASTAARDDKKPSFMEPWQVSASSLTLRQYPEVSRDRSCWWGLAWGVQDDAQRSIHRAA